MNNLILYKGGSAFFLLQNVPKEKPTHYIALMSVETKKVYTEEYSNALDLANKNSIEIVNPNDIPGLVWIDEEYGWCDVKSNKILKPGDAFPLPEGILFKDVWVISASSNESSKYVECTEECAKANIGFGSHKVIRLYASNEEEKKVRPLKEHFEIETDAGTTLRTFDYIAALEEYIDSIDLNKK